VYHAQPRHSLQRISCPDNGEPRAPVLEPAGFCSRLSKVRSDCGNIAGTIPSRSDLASARRTAGERIAADAATHGFPGAREVLDTACIVSHVIFFFPSLDRLGERQVPAHEMRCDQVDLDLRGSGQGYLRWPRQVRSALAPSSPGFFQNDEIGHTSEPRPHCVRASPTLSD